MERRQWLQRTLASVVALVSAPASALMGATEQATGEDGGIAALHRAKSEWRKLLTPEQHDVLFEEGTERPYSSPLDKEKRLGTYVCAACYLPLFTSQTKYDSGTGWPSFYEPIAGRMATKRDYWLIVPRTEYHCVRCSGHQGHVFGDGPAPTGQRWCNNGVALKFVPQGEPPPPLRT